MKWTAIFLLFCLTSCYTGYDDDDYSLVPLTNNPDLTREKSSPLPQVGY